MKFEEVLPALREGKKIRRANSIVKIDFTENTFCMLSSVDLLGADDWEIIEEPKKVKLRDLTEKEFRNWKNEKCEADCEHCIFENVECAE